MLSYLTKGGVTYGDSENMSPYEREIALSTIQEVLEKQHKAQQEQLEAAKSKKNQDPKSGLTSGVKH